MRKLERYLETHQISQAAFARLIGVSQPAVWKWLHGRAWPSRDALLAISKHTGLSINELLGAK